MENEVVETKDNNECRSSKEIKKEENSSSPLRIPKNYFIIVLITSIVCFLINIFVVQLAQVNGSSMYPTLEDGQMLLVSKISKVTNDYERGDIVIFKHNGKNLIKRLIALPGETIQIIGNDIYINDEKIEDYVDVDMEEITNNYFTDKVTLAEDEYVFFGDNRNNSVDCRQIGPVKRKDIVGKVILRFIPFDTF